jgi:hypothetical protein
MSVPLSNVSLMHAARIVASNAGELLHLGPKVTGKSHKNDLSRIYNVRRVSKHFSFFQLQKNMRISHKENTKYECQTIPIYIRITFFEVEILIPCGINV